jgi:type IV secretory pathway VirD2 relaxase
MLVRDAVQSRLPSAHDEAGRAGLPDKLKPDSSHVRLSVLRRLSASRLFAIGDRAGVLRAAQARSGRAFRLDVRQRVVVKALVSRHAGKGAIRGLALKRHLLYLARPGAGLDGDRPAFFDRSREQVDAHAIPADWSEDRHHFRFIISPEHGDRIADLRGYVREVMRRVAEDLGQRDLEWLGVCHFDTDQPHAHVLIRGRRANGRDLVIPRDYVGYGFRGRAQEVAHERLGDLSRAEAERRVWRETQADRFTGFDRRLVQAADGDRMVDDSVGGHGAWAALMRGRLRRLEALGLARRFGARFQLDEDLEAKLRSLQLRRDVIRTLQQRRLEIGRGLQELTTGRVRGRVVGTGAHDEMGAIPWVIVRDGDGGEHYARLRLGQAPPSLGQGIELVAGVRGAQVQALARGYERGG